MYLVTTRTPTKAISTEYWFDEFRAYLRGDVINATTPENTGAVVEEIEVLDLAKSEGIGFEIEYSWPNKKLLSGIFCDVEVTPGVFLNCDLDVRIDVDGDDINYVVDLGDTIYYNQKEDEKEEEAGIEDSSSKHEFDIQLNRKTVELLEDLITADAAEKEYFDQHKV
jgi:hypothetical protein